MSVEAWASKLAALVREYLDTDAAWRCTPVLGHHPGHVEAVQRWKRDLAITARLVELRAQMRAHIGDPTP